MPINTRLISGFILKIYNVCKVYCPLGLRKVKKFSVKIEIEKVEEKKRGASEAGSSLYFISISILVNIFLLFILGCIIYFASIFGKYRR